LAVSGGTTTLGSGASLSGTGTIDLAGAHTLTLLTDQTLPTGAALVFGGAAAVNGPGKLTNAGSLTLSGDTVGAPLDNLGTLKIAPGASSSLNGAFSNQAGGTLSIEGEWHDVATGHASLTVADGFTNAGTITLTQVGCCTGPGVTLSVVSGTLVNQGTLNSLPGSFGGTRTLAAQLQNLGVMNVSHALEVNKSSAAHTSSGTVSVTAGTLTLTQTGTTPSVGFGGPVSLASGTELAVSGGAATFGSGTVLSGTGTLKLSSVSAALGAPLTTPITWSLDGTTLGGSTLTNGGSLQLKNSTVSAPVMNDGTLEVRVPAAFPHAPNHSSINGALTNSATGSITVQAGNADGPASLTIASGFTNAGSITLTQQYCCLASPSTLAVTSGALINGGTITSLVGDHGGTRTISAAGGVSNEGVIRPGGAGAAGTLVISGGYTQTSAGTLEVDLSGASCTTHDALALGSGSVSLAGTLSVTPVSGCTPAVSSQYTVLSTTAAPGSNFESVTAEYVTAPIATGIELTYLGPE
jgi:hypothetical protein